ncbi:hypothetical protein IKF73_03235 [Candidatus Saccharibacteria bacterium]|nr:hypothetical protein [Candidatus Saccharibacteria bacterium]
MDSLDGFQFLFIALCLISIAYIIFMFAVGVAILNMNSLFKELLALKRKEIQDSSSSSACSEFKPDR